MANMLIDYQFAEFAKPPPFEKTMTYVYSKGDFYCCACFVVFMLVMFLHQSKLVL